MRTLSYPEDQVPTNYGTFEWIMQGQDTIRVSAEQLTINQVAYRGTAEVRKVDGRWRALYGDCWLSRAGHVSDEPTLKAKEIFRKEVERIATEADTPENRRACEVFSLREQLNAASTRIIELKEEIDEQEELVDTLSEQLQQMGEEL